MDEVRTGGLIGQSVKRTEDIRFITGRGRYTDDIARPDTVYAAMVRANVAHARIRSIDTAAARAAAGVVAIYTGADMATDKIGGLPCGWAVKNRDGSPQAEPAHPALQAIAFAMSVIRSPSSSPRRRLRRAPRPN